MRQLKSLGLNTSGLKTFYITNVRSIISYGAPAWHSLLSKGNRLALEGIQRSATRIITPDLEYDQRVLFLSLPMLNDFLNDLSAKHFIKITSNDKHPLFSRIHFNTSRVSSRAKKKSSRYRPETPHTATRSNSFFQFYMSYFDNNHIYHK